MKPISSLVLTIFLFSCGAPTPKSDKSDQQDNWQKSNHVFTVNTYSKSGLLDTSYKTTYLYQEGMLVDTYRSIVVRHYENSKLTNERGYSLFPDGTKTLSRELIKQYDAKGNLILQVNKMGGDIISKETTRYNSQGQIVEVISLFQISEDNPRDYILGSAVVHRNDKKQLKYHTSRKTYQYNQVGKQIRTMTLTAKGSSIQYDTAVTDYEYDHAGNEIRTVTKDTRGKILTISMSNYSGKELSLWIEITPQGDTLSKITYVKEGHLIKQVAVKESGSVDTTWLDKGNIIKVIGHDHRLNMKYKFVTFYDNKGHEIESISYN